MANFTAINQLDGVWHGTKVQPNVQFHGRSMLPQEVTLTCGQGPLSQLLDGLGASRILKLDVNADAQMVLNRPLPLGAVLKNMSQMQASPFFRA